MGVLFLPLPTLDNGQQKRFRGTCQEFVKRGCIADASATLPAAAGCVEICPSSPSLHSSSGTLTKVCVGFCMPCSRPACNRSVAYAVRDSGSVVRPSQRKQHMSRHMTRVSLAIVLQALNAPAQSVAPVVQECCRQQQGVNHRYKEQVHQVP